MKMNSANNQSLAEILVDGQTRATVPSPANPILPIPSRRFCSSNPILLMKNNISFTLKVPALCWLFSVFLMITATQADQNPPDKLTYQGFLTDQNGAPLGDTAPTNKTVIFRIYDMALSGAIKWAEQQSVTIDKGHFSVLLGQGTAVAGPWPILPTVFTGVDASERYMQITVDGTDLLPRLQFLSAPYALLAKSANQVVDPLGNTVLSTGTRSIGINISVTPSSALDVGGVITATGLKINGRNESTSFVGNGVALTDLNATYLATGTVSDGRLSTVITGGAALANEATSGNTVNRIVKRDATGNFTANTITANDFVGGGTIPLGGIIMWAGDAAPTGWALCDGQYSTPDLRGRFILGAGTGIDRVPNAVNAVGGSRTVTFTMTIAQMPKHNHHLPGSKNGNPDGSWDWANYNGYYNAQWGLDYGNIPDTLDTGGDLPVVMDNMPPYYVLAYIQRKQ